MLLDLGLWPRRRRNCTSSHTTPDPFLNDERWELISDLFPQPTMTRAGGRPPVPPRECLEGGLWILHSGARWKDLPERHPSPSTCWRQLKQWTESGVFREIWIRLLKTMDQFREINWEEAIGDGTFAPAKKGGELVGNTKKGKGTKIMLMVDREGTPLSVDIAGANKAKVNLIEELVEQRVLDRKPKRLMSDKAANSDPLCERLGVQEIELICRHRKNRVKPATQDGRAARRLARRYRVERTISWLLNHRRLTVRYEHDDHLYLGFVQLACMFTIIKWF